jgi:hypothetical protein
MLHTINVCSRLIKTNKYLHVWGKKYGCLTETNIFYCYIWKKVLKLTYIKL